VQLRVKRPEPALPRELARQPVPVPVPVPVLVLVLPEPAFPPELA
jgi:hypothetical protein